MSSNVYSVEQNLLGETVKALLEKPEFKEKLEIKLREYLETPGALNKIFERVMEQSYYGQDGIGKKLSSIISEVFTNKKDLFMNKAEECLTLHLGDPKLFVEILRDTLSREIYTLAKMAVEKSAENRKKVAAKKKSAKLK